MWGSGGRAGQRGGLGWRGWNGTGLDRGYLAHVSSEPDHSHSLKAVLTHVVKSHPASPHIL